MAKQPRKAHPVVAILRDDYDAFLALCSNDPQFPKTYEAWIARTVHQLDRDIRVHTALRKVVVHPEEFAAWCRANGQNPCFALLEAFAASAPDP